MTVTDFPDEQALQGAVPLAAAGIDPPLWMQNATFPALVDRALLDAIWSTPGIVGIGELAVGPRAAGGNMSVDVAAGRCVVGGTDAPGQGKYLCRSTAVQNLVIAAAPGAGLSRIDRVVAHVYDDALIGGALHEWRLEVVNGVAAASPVAPALPPSSLLLAEVTVPSGLAAVAAGNIAERRVLAGTTAGAVRTGIIASGPQISGPAVGAALTLNTVIAGPTSWLAANMITLPPGAGGLYLIDLTVAFVAQATVWNAAELRNSAGAALSFIVSLSSQNLNQTQYLHGQWLAQLADGATLRAHALNSSPSLGVSRFSLLRVGDVMGGAGAIPTQALPAEQPEPK